jgi:hypothetical protein
MQYFGKRIPSVKNNRKKSLGAMGFHPLLQDREL